MHYKAVLTLAALVIAALLAGCAEAEVIIAPTDTAVPVTLEPSPTPPPDTPTAVQVFTGGATLTPNLPVTATIPPLTLVFPPTATPLPCVPREDWTGTYTIQAGDTLFAIASNFGLTTAELQTANCIDDANSIFAGEDIRIPLQPSPTPIS
ncbi:MAG: LysM peptidoglycan-binding domain-containing protein [Anaerolineae bacterium]|nr:LysM peptidoglycan-binding domain-containing protein [Anaerolineae bacterium]